MIGALKNFSIDKSDWTPVKFGDVVYEPKESVKDPAAAGIEHVVGLEHIDSEDIHLRRSASIEDGTTFTKKFDIDDVLFGRRRAYLKKAAKAEFFGICSGDIIVMRAKDNLLPELLPFIVNNDKFFDFAIKHSAGGLSPRVKFKNLAEYELHLPPQNMQIKLAGLLNSGKISFQANKVIEAQIENLRQSVLKEIYTVSSDVLVPTESVKIGDLVKLSSGKSRPKELQDFKTNSHKYPVYGGNGILGYSKEYLIDFPTIILGRVGEYCGAVHASVAESWISDNALYVKEFKRDIDQIYLSRFLEYIDLNAQQNKSSYPLITQGKVNTNKINLYTREITSKFVSKILQVETLLQLASAKTLSAKLVQKGLLREIF